MADEEKFRLLPPAPERARKIADRHWLGERLRAVFLDSDPAQDEPQDGRRRRIMDLFVSPGRVTAKVHDETGKPRRIELVFRQLTDSEWTKVFDLLSTEALFAAKLLAGHLPLALEEKLSEAGLPLVPASSADVRFLIDGKRAESTIEDLRPVLQKLVDLAEDDPFVLFLLRGRGRNETLHELKTRRAASRPAATQFSQRPQLGIDHEPAPPLLAAPGDFWNWGQGIEELTYTIKADELPAAILRRLDPLPFGGIEEEIDFLIEDAYAMIARRAQAFGLGMKTGS